MGGYRYSPPPTHPAPVVPTPGTPPRWSRCPTLGTHGPAPRLKYAMGLKSVGQLTLSVQISHIEGMTEVYNLVRIDIPDDHNLIAGNE